ncbi:phage tail tape measure protein, TP901 family [Photorhabdus temperata subsp. temperata Meg1]|uniref:Phage tail tape measure protein, TP901 family n=1 Tax=Photorhabdus temperata subsp. temperata Meg1 TaxID=1393735 RepID=A0A081S1P0_PHOTE|nr:phage tail tape measure protein, TP901 family [Photorhabdus temperata subsp. temperata Meg1]
MSKTFGTSMEEIADLMEGARAAGKHFGAGIDEQLAVLGELHRSLGTESSSVYESFLTYAVEGAKKLSISFVNASGHMLTLPEMLEKLQAKYGKSIESNLKAQKEIEEAFGDSAIVVKQLYGNVDMLRKNISALGANDGLKRAREMAERMANPWARLHAIWQNICIAVGSTLLPVISSLVNRLANAGQLLVRWLKLFPNIARWVGYITLGILSFAAAGVAANIVMGVSKFIWISLKGIWAACTLLMKLGVAAVCDVGSGAHSMFAGKPVEIPNEFSQHQSAGNAMTIPMIPSLRLGVVINQHRLNKVNLNNENMVITWEAVNKLTGQSQTRTPMQRQIDAAYPELSAGLHLPKFARIEAHTENTVSGDISDPFRPRYAVDVQLLLMSLSLTLL